MKIIVFIKQVPDTAIGLKINSDETDIEYKDIPWVINPYDEYAVEESLRIKEKIGGSVTVVSMGPARVADIIRSSLAMGVDEAIYVNNVDNSDAYSTAFILSKTANLLGYDIILCGKQAVDDGLGQVGPALAEILNIPSISSILKLEISENKSHAIVTREIDEGIEILESPLPALFTTQKGLNEPRYASLPGIMKAKKKEIKIIDANRLGIFPEAAEIASMINIKRLSYPLERKKGKIMEGESRIIVKELITLLRNEARVI